MGRNNRQRRAAKQRKRSNHGGRPRPAGSEGAFSFGTGPDPVYAQSFADLMLVRRLRGLGVGASAAEARREAELALQSISPVPVHYARRAMRDLVDRLLDPVLGSWSPAELGVAVDRKVDPACRRLLAGLLDRRRGRPEAAGPDWVAELAELGTPAGLALQSLDDWADVFRLARLLSALPSGAVPSRRSPTARERATDAKLARVRGLLAKAESTPYPEEAEALSAKAQHLIAKYSLERLVDHAQTHSAPGDETLDYRRLWLDAPYVSAKATLVHEVARANHSRAVFDATLGLSTVVGAPFDLDAIGLLVTSLLSQAQRAMLVHGRVADRDGTSRTRSFRQSFLTSFAIRIGERLRAATEESLAAHHERASLVPVIAGHDDDVARLTDALFPGLVEKTTAVSNAEGWAGGRAAAELALLDIYGRLEDTDEPGGGAVPRGAVG